MGSRGAGEDEDDKRQTMNKQNRQVVLIPRQSYLFVLLTDLIVGQHVSAILGNLQAKI